MKSQELAKLRLPDTPGVYIFRGKAKKPLYIGKATSLKSRVRSYFDRDIAKTRGPHIKRMTEDAQTVDFMKTDSVLEALILEARLIKKHQPYYNTKEKDDKSFNYVVITKEDFPRVLLMRGKNLLDPRYKPGYEIQYFFGPFPQGTILKDALKIIRKIFPFRDTCLPAITSRAKRGASKVIKPCFNRQIGLCPGVCTGEISKREYARTIRNLRLFFQGEKKTLLTKLQHDMSVAAKGQRFEQAGEIKKTIFSLKHIHDIALVKNSEISPDQYNFRIEAYDVAHLSGKNMVGVMCVVEDGTAQKSEYRKFKIRSFEGANDTRALTEILERRLAHIEWPLPRLVVVDGGVAQKNAALRVFSAAGVRIPVVGVVKNKRHQPERLIGNRMIRSTHESAIILANAEAHRFAINYHRNLRDTIKAPHNKASKY